MGLGGEASDLTEKPLLALVYFQLAVFYIPCEFKKKDEAVFELSEK